MRCAVVAGVVGLAAAGLLVAVAGPAWAHPTVVGTVPQAGYSVSTTPDQVAVIFDEPVSAKPTGLLLSGQARGTIAVSTPRVVDDDRTLAAAVLGPLPPGQYTVRWQVTAVDGDLVEGTFTFGVGQVARQDGGIASAGTIGLPIAAGLRWVVFGGISLALGGVVGQRLIARPLLATPGRTNPLGPEPLIVTGCVLGLVGTFGLAVHQLGGGSLSDGVTAVSPSELLSSPAGRILAAQIAAFAFALTAALARIPSMTVAALGAVLLGEGQRSHLHAAAGLGGSVTIVVHLAGAAVWVGALVHLVRASLRWRGEKLLRRAFWVRYAALAAWLYAAVVATGTVAALLVIPSADAVLGTAYGRVLVAKLTLVGLVSALAVAGRRRLRRSPEPAGWPAGLMRAERLGLLVVLAVTSVLTSVSPPGSSVAPLLPTAVTGPAVRLGTLTGAVTTAFTASERQVEVRLSVPEQDPQSTQIYRVTGAVTGPAGQPDELVLTSCGTGCFWGTAPWRSGVNEVTLSITAPGWAAGTARFRVPWPVQERPELMAHMLQVMRAEPTVDVVEQVTSDTSASPPPPQELPRLTGAEFIDLQPYRSPAAGAPVELSRTDDVVVLGVGLPAERIFAELTVDANGRLVAVRITTPNHLITQTFTYPPTSAEG